MVGHIAEKCYISITNVIWCYKHNGYLLGYKLHGKEKPIRAYANQASIQHNDDNNVADANLISLSKG